MARSIIVYAGVFATGVVGGLALASLLIPVPDSSAHSHDGGAVDAAPRGERGERIRAERPKEPDADPIAPEAAGDSATGPAPAAVGEPPALSPPAGAIEDGLYTREEWDQALAAATNSKWGGTPTVVEVDESARYRALERRLPFALKAAPYQNRAFLSDGTFRAFPQYKGGRARAAPLTAARQIPGQGAAPGDREALRASLWSLEERRREAELAIVERENVLIREKPPILERHEDVEFWFTDKGAVFILREGADAEHARLLRALEAIDIEVDRVRSEFHARFR